MLVCIATETLNGKCIYLLLVLLMACYLVSKDVIKSLAFPTPPTRTSGVYGHTKEARLENSHLVVSIRKWTSISRLSQPWSRSPYSAGLKSSAED